MNDGFSVNRSAFDAECENTHEAWIGSSTADGTDSGIHSKTSKQGIATIEVAFQTKGRDQITKIVEKIRQIESVMDIERTTG